MKVSMSGPKSPLSEVIRSQGNRRVTWLVVQPSPTLEQEVKYGQNILCVCMKTFTGSGSSEVKKKTKTHYP